MVNCLRFMLYSSRNAASLQTPLWAAETTRRALLPGCPDHRLANAQKLAGLRPVVSATSVLSVLVGYRPTRFRGLQNNPAANVRQRGIPDARRSIAPRAPGVKRLAW